jgi:hypothetical protein
MCRRSTCTRATLPLCRCQYMHRDNFTFVWMQYTHKNNFTSVSMPVHAEGQLYLCVEAGTCTRTTLPLCRCQYMHKNNFTSVSMPVHAQGQLYLCVDASTCPRTTLPLCGCSTCTRTTLPLCRCQYMPKDNFTFVWMQYTDMCAVNEVHFRTVMDASPPPPRMFSRQLLCPSSAGHQGPPLSAPKYNEHDKVTFLICASFSLLGQ